MVRLVKVVIKLNNMVSLVKLVIKLNGLVRLVRVVIKLNDMVRLKLNGSKWLVRVVIWVKFALGPPSAVYCLLPIVYCPI